MIIINIYRQKFNIPLNLTKNEISKEKTKALGIFKNFELLDLCKKLTTNDIKVNINSTDIFYDYENKNKKIKEKRKEKVIFITTDKMEEDIKNKDIENYFIDITYRIIPKNKKNYKLLTYQV